METYLLHTVQRSLSFHLYQNAVFLAERLFAQFPSFHNMFTLANCHYSSGQIQTVYHFLRHQSTSWKVYTSSTLSHNFSSQDIQALDQIYYLYVVCCVKLNKLSEAENIILQYLAKREFTINESPMPDFDMISNLNYWLGIICRYTDRRQMAIAYFQKALSSNPFLWCAFENLSQLGVVIDSGNIFDKSKAPLLLSKYTVISVNNNRHTHTSITTAMEKPTRVSVGQHHNLATASSATSKQRSTTFNSFLMTPQASSMEALLESNPLQFTGTPSSGIMTPMKDSLTTPATNMSYMSPSGFDDFTIKSPSITNSSKSTRRESSGLSLLSNLATPSTKSTPITNGNNSSIAFLTPSPIGAPSDFTPPLGPVRKPKQKKKLQDPIGKKLPGKLFESSKMGHPISSGTTPSDPNFSLPSTHSSSASHIGNLSTSRISNIQINTPPPYPINQSILQSTSKSVTADTPFNPSSQQAQTVPSLSVTDSKDVTEKDIGYLLMLLDGLAKPLQLFYQYRCREAIQFFTMLPPKQFQTGWVLLHIGKSYFELTQYENGEKAFEQVVKLEPYRLDGLEVYSTILWHLKKKKQLSYLAHHMSEIDKLSPQTLCAIGNCFSLQKDHESALKFFERATKVNSFFTYGYTLAGHESFANDDLDEALASYRKAIRIDCRHYNAWYGIGVVYFRQEKHEQAEYHFRKALRINDKSSVLYCYTGMALTARKKYPEALHMLNCALQIHPQNPVAKFKKANVLVAMDQDALALKELDELRQLVPKEASVYFTIGKIYARLGQKDQALFYFNMALDLERTGQKENPFIKEQIAKLFEEDEEDDEEEEEEGEDDGGYDDDEYEQ